jgi:hypothetical protein
MHSFFGVSLSVANSYKMAVSYINLLVSCFAHVRTMFE